MITLKQLAEELNISVSTVSKALNDSYEISEETIKRVKEAAKLHNYRPNKTALNLRSQQTRTIGVIIPDILNRYLAKVLYGIEREANDKGYDIITCISNELLSKEMQSLEFLSNGTVDGFILAASRETQSENQFEHLNQTIDKGYPIVMFDRVLPNVNCNKVITNDSASTYNITKEFIALKKTKIAFVTSISELYPSKLREEGYLKAIQENNLDSFVLNIKNTEDKQAALKTFLKKNTDIEAIISADSTLGTIAINVALSLGYKVPKDIAVVGFASESVSNLSVPKLTVIKQHAKEVGRSAVNLLIEQLKNKNSTSSFVEKVVETSLIKKGSF